MSLQEIITKRIKSEYISGKRSVIAPLVSGAISLYFFREIVFSNLSDTRYYVSLALATVLFVTSAIVSFFLRKIERDRERLLLNTLSGVIEDVYTQYGVAKKFINFLSLFKKQPKQKPRMDEDIL